MKEKLSLHITKRSEHVLQWSKAIFLKFLHFSWNSVKKKSIWNWIHTLYDYWNFISFLIQQTFVYLVLKFIFILVCSHYRNRTLSVLHNLRNSLVYTDKKINWATAVPTWNQPWPYLYHFTLFWNRTTPQQQLKST